MVGSTVTVDLRADAASAQSVAAIDAILAWNPAELQFPGVLVPQLDVVIMLPTSPTGTLLLVTPWPAGIPHGFSIYYQYWMKDPGAVLGWAASNGLRSTTG